MKSNPKVGSNGPPTPNRPGPLDEARRQALDAQLKRRNEQTTLWRALGLGTLAVGAVFVSLELLESTSKRPQTAQLEAHRPAQTPDQSKPSPTQASDPAAMDTPAPASQDLTIPAPPTVTPGDAETAAMEATEADRLAKEPEMLLAGPDSQREAARNRDQELLKRTIDGKAWDAYRALLGRSVKAGLAKLAKGQGLNRFDAVWNEPVLYQALLRWKTLGCFSESEITALVTDSYTGGMFTWLLNDNKAMEELLLTFHPKDDGGKVLKFLTDSWPVNEDKYAKYFPLALACAVVFDESMTIPNPVGKTENGVESEVDPMKRYLWYVAKNETGKLAAPVHHSSARDLVWAVCAPITTSELEWSIDKMHYRRKNWGDAYGLIEYLMERAVEGLNPYKEYSFAEILKEGGICGDQSYFCVNTARAQGIPAMIISGETDAGGHAWAGIKIDDDEWTTSVGRVGGASKGQAGNPQTGDPITEQEIQLWNDRFHQSPVVTLSVWRHLWLADFFSAMDGSVDQRRGHPSRQSDWPFVYRDLASLVFPAGAADPPHRKSCRPKQP